jgi:hypothetical protein
MTANPSRVGDYLRILENQDYSYLMSDGGIVQISYTFDRLQISSHRLAFYPCPFDITPHDLSAFDGGLLDLIQNVFMNDLEAGLLLRSPIRFDYSPDCEADFHPASHITINDPSCRIPVSAPMSFSTFMKFILENFYNEAWCNSSISKELVFRQEKSCLSKHDGARAFLTWAYS